jgi:hypothetical protein
MKKLLTEEQGVAKSGKNCGNETNRKNATQPVAVEQEMTFDQLALRCNSETAVLKRILNFPIFH